MNFSILSSVSLALSGVALKVHVVNIGCLFLAYVIPLFVAERHISTKPKYLTWIVGGLIDLVFLIFYLR